MKFILSLLIIMVCLMASFVAKADETAFDILPPNTEQLEKMQLWATYYHIWHTNEGSTGKPLLDKSNHEMTGNIPLRDWCNSAVEGTVLVTARDGSTKTYNYIDHRGAQQVDCAKVLKISAIKKPWITATGRSRYGIAGGPYGDGVLNYKLIPYRTIAVDRSKIPYGSVIYIPQARGVTVTLPSGSTVVHDGYFFAADTGGAIKDQHIDIFSGISTSNPFPLIVKSTESAKFDAYLIQQADIIERLKNIHQ